MLPLTEKINVLVTNTLALLEILQSVIIFLDGNLFRSLTIPFPSLQSKLLQVVMYIVLVFETNSLHSQN